MQLSLNTQDHVQVLFGFDEVAEIRRHHLSYIRTSVGLGPHDMDGLSCRTLVEGRLMVIIPGGDEVGLVDRWWLAIEEELQVVDAVFVLVH